MQRVAQQKDTDKHPFSTFKFQYYLPNPFSGRESFQNTLLYIYSKSFPVPLFYGTGNMQSIWLFKDRTSFK